MKVVAKAVKKEVMKKRTPVVEKSSSFDNEISLPPSKKINYIVLEVALKND
jgi:hypothetical protein